MVDNDERDDAQENYDYDPELDHEAQVEMAGKRIPDYSSKETTKAEGEFTRYNALIAFLNETLRTLGNVAVIYRGQSYRLSDANLPHAAARAWLKRLAKDFENTVAK